MAPSRSHPRSRPPAPAEPWDAVAELVRQWVDAHADRLRAAAPNLVIDVIHRHLQSAIIHGSWVELYATGGPDDPSSYPDIIVELVFMREPSIADLTVYDHDQATIVNRELPIDPALDTDEVLAAARQALSLAGEHVAEMEAELQRPGR
jgi:hypothetical protein